MAIVVAQENTYVITGLQDLKKSTSYLSKWNCVQLLAGIENIFQPDDDLSEMSMEEDLPKLKLTKKRIQRIYC